MSTPTKTRSITMLQGLCVFSLGLIPLAYGARVKTPIKVQYDVKKDTNVETDALMQMRFDAWTSVHGKSYSTVRADSSADASEPIYLDKLTMNPSAESEYLNRLKIFSKNHARISEMIGEKANQTWSLSYEGPFMDLEADEFTQFYLGFRGDKVLRAEDVSLRRDKRIGKTLPYSDHQESLAESGKYNNKHHIDWRHHQVVTPVKNQAECGSCWAFSAIGAVEAVNAMATGSLVSLSEEELVACDTADNGCGGGQMDNAFEFIIDNGGVTTEANYPYTSSMGMVPVCNVTRENDRAVSIDGYEDVMATETALQEAIFNQPISVAVDAQLWQFYGGGVFDGMAGYCGTSLNHGVVLVGLHKPPTWRPAGPGYYLVKNSWGAKWGEEGYIRLAIDRGEDGMCGIAKMASYPIKAGANTLVRDQL